MTEEQRRHRVHDLFTEAVELPAADRQAFLARGEHDPQLVSSVQKLLAAYDQAGSFLSDPQVMIDPLLMDESRQRIGQYRLERVIGQGGHGTVYLAKQDKPLERQVAVKVIRAGRDTRQMLARFDFERQAVARIDHPNVAKVFDAGTTPDGRPYFVMEWVDGKPVTDFCQSRNLNLNARLSLFREICSAVQHAHQKGIIHRDLKPTNVLVVERDGRFIPKVIDFGIAKAISSDVAGDLEMNMTQDRQLLGTPQYMSPEQLGDDPRDIDTRVDIYALGALLYELLTDQPPFDAKTLRSAALDEVRRILREEQPPRPSVKAPAKRPPRELDWVVFKAIEKDRSRRYPTAEALSADVERFLTDKPVEASPPSLTYQASRFMRRHRRLVVTAGIVIASLIGGATAATYGLLKARAERDRAVIAESAEAVQRKNAEETAKRLFSAKQFVYRLVVQAAPVKTPPAILDYLSQRADDGLLADQPEVLATLHLALGMAYQRLDQAEQAILHYHAYLALQPQPLPDSVNNASALHNLGAAILSKDDYVASRPLFEQSLEMYHRMSNGRDDVNTAPVLEHLGITLANAEQLKDAEPLLRKSMELLQGDPGASKRQLMGVMAELAQVLDGEGRHDEAKVLWAKSKPVWEKQHVGTKPD